METVLLGTTLVVLAGVTFLNGFHDASNAVATAVRTRALTPYLALAVVAGFTALGALIFSSFATTLVGRFDTALPGHTSGLVILLVGFLVAGGWGLFTWWQGQPSSSTHAVLAAISGAAMVAALASGFGLAEAAGLMLRQVLLPMLVTTLLAPVLAYVIVVPLVWAVRHSSPRRANEAGRSAQAIGTCAVALSHGLQDGQRAVALSVVTLGTVGAQLPSGSVMWLQVGAAVLLAAGVLGGGWRITHTLSARLVTLDPLRAGAANITSAGMLFIGAFVLHAPISSTQAVTAGLVGAGLNQSHSTVNWATAMRIMSYWIITPLVCGLLAAVLYLAASPLLH